MKMKMAELCAHGMCYWFMLLMSGLLGVSSTPAHKYHYVQENKTWTEALSYCREKHTDLATVDNMEEMKMLKAAVDGGYRGAVWIGLRRSNQSYCGWSLGKNTLSQYSNWTNLTIGPTLVGTCGVIHNGKWHLHNCIHTHFSVCYNDTAGPEERFVYIQNALTWSDAQNHCRKSYTDLASISTPEEHQQVLSLIGKLYSDYVWIGLFSDTWEWRDNSNTSFRYWANSEPNQSDTCTSANMNDSGRWYVEDCSLKHHFICYNGLLGVCSSAAHQYHHVKESKTWTEAQSYCREKHTDLATVDNMDEMKMLKAAVDGGYRGAAWIGLRNTKQARWGWSLGNNTLCQYPHWTKTSISDKNLAKCGVMFGGEWYPHYCDHHHYSLCYYETGNPDERFIPIKIQQNWTEAQNFCRNYYTDLASICSPEEHQQANNLMTNSSFNYMWIGLFSDIWEWSDNSSSSFRYWANSEPNQNDSCVSANMNNSERWYGEDCSLKLNFICYNECKKQRKQLVRVKVTSDGNKDLNVNAVKQAILKQIEEKLKAMGVGNDTKLSWKETHGKVFQPEMKKAGNKVQKKYNDEL